MAFPHFITVCELKGNLREFFSFSHVHPRKHTEDNHAWQQVSSSAEPSCQLPLLVFWLIPDLSSLLGTFEPQVGFAFFPGCHVRQDRLLNETRMEPLKL